MWNTWKGRRRWKERFWETLWRKEGTGKEYTWHVKKEGKYRWKQKKERYIFSKYVIGIYSQSKCTLVQALRLCTGRTAHRGSRGIALLFHDYGTRREWGVSVTPRSLFTPRKDPVPIVQEAGWAPRPVWIDAENLARTGIRFSERPARSQSLYRPRYRAHIHKANQQ